MDTRLKKLMCLLAALVMMLLPVADVGIVNGVQAEANPDSENRPVSPDASKFEYLLLHNGKTITDGNPLVYVGDKVDISGFTCIELETDLQVSSEFIRFELEGPIMNGTYVAAEPVTVKVVEINSGFVLCAEVFDVLPNELDVTEIPELTYTAEAIEAKDFVSAVTMNGQAYTDYKVTCLSAAEIKNVGEYVLQVDANDAALKAEPVQVKVNVVKATPVAAVAQSTLKYTGEVLTAKDFGMSVKLGGKDVLAECIVTPSAEIKNVGAYTITAFSSNLNPVSVSVKVEYLVTDAVATIDDANLNKDTNEYYGESVTLVAPEGYTIGLDQTTFADTVVVALTGEAEQNVQYYLKETATGAITDVMSISYKEDLASIVTLTAPETIHSTAGSITLTSAAATGETVEIVVEYTDAAGNAATATATMAAGQTSVAIPVENMVAGSDVKITYTDAAGYAKTADVAVEPWAALSIAEIEGQPVNSDGVDFINEDGYTITITGEPNQTVVVSYNGVDTEVQLDADGIATVDPAYAEVNEGTAPVAQTLTVAYADTVFAGGAEGDDVTFIYDDDANEPALELTAPKNRDAEWTITLPEYGSVTSVVATWDEETRTIFTADVTDAYSANEAHEQILELKDLYNIPEGAIYTVTFVDLAGHSRTAECEVGKSDVDIDFSTDPTTPNENKRLIARGDLVFDVLGYANETFKAYINGEEYGTYTFDANRECRITIDRDDLVRGIDITISVSYVYVNGTAPSNTFIVDDYCNKPIILTPVYENAYVLAGVVEVGAFVVISYPDYPELGTTYVRPDAYGFFAAELDMLDAGDEVELYVQDLGDNAVRVTLTALSEDELGTQMAYPMGKLFTDSRYEDQPWLVATKVKVADLKEGVTLPILANNCFEIGEFTATMDEAGNVVYNYSVDDSVAEVVDSYMTYAKKVDYAAFAGRTSAAVNAGEAFAIDANAKEIWIYAEFIVELDVDAMVESFQLESARDNEVKLEYTKLQRN